VILEEGFSIECIVKLKPNYLTNQTQAQQRNEPIRIQGKYATRAKRGKTRVMQFTFSSFSS